MLCAVSLTRRIGEIFALSKAIRTRLLHVPRLNQDESAQDFLALAYAPSVTSVFPPRWWTVFAVRVGCSATPQCSALSSPVRRSNPANPTSASLARRRIGPASRSAQGKQRTDISCFPPIPSLDPKPPQMMIQMLVHQDRPLLRRQWLQICRMRESEIDTFS
jgi:hypothetical protein